MQNTGLAVTVLQSISTADCSDKIEVVYSNLYVYFSYI